MERQDKIKYTCKTHQKMNIKIKKYKKLKYLF